MLNHKYCRAHTGLTKVHDENCSAVTQKPKKKNEPKEKSASTAPSPFLQSAPSGVGSTYWVAEISVFRAETFQSWF
jgi:hypothetical protein